MKQLWSDHGRASGSGNPGWPLPPALTCLVGRCPVLGIVPTRTTTAASTVRDPCAVVAAATALEQYFSYYDYLAVLVLVAVYVAHIER